MLSEIPILINKRGTQEAFKILPLQRNNHLHHRRQRTYDQDGPKADSYQKNGTLDLKGQRGSVRYRRASSSGHTSKFPKDFFKENVTPAKGPLSSSKKLRQRSYSDAKTNIAKNECPKFTSENKRCHQQSVEPFLPSEDLAQTPKFNKKKAIDVEDSPQKVTKNSKKVKLDDYLNFKKNCIENFTAFPSKNEVSEMMYETFQNCEAKLQINKEDKNAKMTNKVVENNISSRGGLDSLSKKKDLILLQSRNMLDCQLLPTLLKKKSIKSQKENFVMHESQKNEKKRQKNIKQFLSTKGLNWKLVHNASNTKMKFSNKSGPEGQEKQKLLTFRKKDDSNTPQESKNASAQSGYQGAFRIRKYI